MGRPRIADEYRLSERKSGRAGWVLHYRDDNDERKVITAPTARAAMNKWKARLGEKTLGKAPRDAGPKAVSHKMVRGWLGHWITGAERPRWSGAQLQSAREYIWGYILQPKHATRWAGLPTAAVTDDDIRDLLATVKREEGERRRRTLLKRLQKQAKEARTPPPEELTAEQRRRAELSDRTLLKLFGMIRVALEDAKRKHLIADNPARGMPHGFSVRPEPRPILGGADTELYLRLALARTKDGQWVRHHGPLLAFLLCSGARLGECQAMRWSCISWLRDELRIAATASKVPKSSELRDGHQPKPYQLRDGEEWITDRLIRKGPKTERGKRTISIKGTLQRNILRALWQDRAPENIRDWPDKPRLGEDAEAFDGDMEMVQVETAVVSGTTMEGWLDAFLADNPATQEPSPEVTEFLASPIWIGPQGKPAGANAVRSAHREIIEAMGGNSHMVVHDLRHSAASRLGGVGGANIVETAAILGHSGLMEVLTYGHLVDTRGEEIAERDGALLGVELDREAGFSEDKWGEAAFYHRGPGEIVKHDERRSGHPRRRS